MKDTISNLMFDRIFSRDTQQVFLNFCARRGWVGESVVEVEDFEQCLEEFKNEYPQHAHNVLD